MKFKIIFLSFTLVATCLAQQNSSFFEPLREGDSNYELKSKYHKKLEVGFEVKFKDLLNKIFLEELEIDELIKASKDRFSKVIVDNCGRDRRCHNRYVEGIFTLARKKSFIDDVFLFHVKHHLADRKKKLSVLDYFYKLEFTINERSTSLYQEKITESLFNNKREYVKKEKGFGKLTPRQRLFLFYSEDEISLMAEYLSTFLNRNFAEESYLVFANSNGEDDKIALSRGEQYQAAVRLFDRDIKRAVVDGKLSRPPLYSDILASGLELGIISNDLLNEILLMPEFKDQYMSIWKKIGRIAGRVGRTILVINPTTTLYAMTAFLVIDSARQIKEQNEKISDDHLF